MMMMMQQKQQRVIHHHPRNEILHSSKRRRFHHGATTIQTTTRRKSRGKYGRGCGARKAVTSFSSVSANKVEEDESKDIDVVTLGNMCVDVFHSVESLPEDKNELKTMETLNDLLTRTEKMKAMGCEELEVGGNTNFLIAARRLGLKAVSLGQIGNDFYGTFMKDVLREERVGFRSYEEKQNSSTSSSAPSTSESRTLVCFVLVDGSGSHAFCSSYDLGPWPLLAEKYKLGADVKAALRKSKAMFVNGFAFDELAPNDVVDAADIIHKHDGTVFFDPGPRAFTFHETELRKKALISLIKRTDVVLATAEELAALVEHPNPNEELLQNPRTLAYSLFNHPQFEGSGNLEWIVVKLGPDGAILFSKNDMDIDSTKVGSPTIDVGDTVGCGDSAASAIVMGFLEYKKLMSTKSDSGKDSSNGSGSDNNGSRSSSNSNSTTMTTTKEAKQLSAKATLALATAVGAATASRTGAGRNVATKQLAQDLLIAQGGEERKGACEYSEALRMLKRYVD
jgi:sugar/nucleoside kinase (ribokinase family)